MKLSIITINFNNEAGLKKTIKSVASQTFHDYEYIIIDGGSTDGSVDIVKQYANTPLPCGEGLGERFYWISEPDKGIFNAMNKGILQAKGEFCYFLNSGDCLYANDLLSVVFQENYEEDIITGNFIEQYKNKTVLKKGRAYFREQEGKSLTLFDFFCGSLSHQATFIRKRLFDEYGLYDENYKTASDWLFFFKTIGLYSVKVKYIDVNIVYFDMNGVSNIRYNFSHQEKMTALEDLLPPAIFEDYKHFQKMERDFHNLSQYKLFYLVARLINKLATLYDILDTKIRLFGIARGIKFKHKEKIF
jgi:glycosyltransferase involved in cell wall biosynthesis